jgi:hypothetical protein
MAQPQSITLKKGEINKVLKLASGNSKTKGLSARSISEETGFARRQVMAVLEDNGLAAFSSGSYN